MHIFFVACFTDFSLLFEKDQNQNGMKRPDHKLFILETNYKLQLLARLAISIRYFRQRYSLVYCGFDPKMGSASSPSVRFGKIVHRTIVF
jgi:hypothetical protein